LSWAGSSKCGTRSWPLQARSIGSPVSRQIYQSRVDDFVGRGGTSGQTTAIRCRPGPRSTRPAVQLWVGAEDRPSATARESFGAAWPIQSPAARSIDSMTYWRRARLPGGGASRRTPGVPAAGLSAEGLLLHPTSSRLGIDSDPQLRLGSAHVRGERWHRADGRSSTRCVALIAPFRVIPERSE
jgi:hypothetical protein